MNRITSLVPLALLGAVLSFQTVQAAEDFPRWNIRIDMGGVIPEDPNVTKFDGPVSGQTMKLDAGFQFDLAAGYRLTPWLDVGPELGFTYNYVDSIAGWSYPNTWLGQILMMANVRIEYPPQGPVAPFVGAGVGGVASFLTFGGSGPYSYYDDYYYEPDGTAADIVLGVQAFAGVRVRMSDKVNLGIVYRYLATQDHDWDVNWWDGRDFGISVDSIRMHSICLLISGEF
jgi:opacity protein-like surface antigen